jgi:hypothetical protein
MPEGVVAFLECERGVITIEWMTLSAAIVGLVVAVLGALIHFGIVDTEALGASVRNEAREQAWGLVGGKRIDPGGRYAPGAPVFDPGGRDPGAVGAPEMAAGTEAGHDAPPVVAAPVAGAGRMRIE